MIVWCVGEDPGEVGEFAGGLELVCYIWRVLARCLINASPLFSIAIDR